MKRRALLLLALGVLVLTAGGAFTAANTVASSRIGAGGSAVAANDLKPVECAALDLELIRDGGGGGGGGANSLVLGTPGNDNLVGASGDDCLFGGNGNDVLRGTAGFDVCVGGPGNDSFHQSCETRIQ